RGHERCLVACLPRPGNHPRSAAVTTVKGPPPGGPLLPSVRFRRMQHLVMLRHVPWQYPGRQVQEVQILLEMVENVADQFPVVITVDVIGLAAAAQKDLGTVVE